MQQQGLDKERDKVYVIHQTLSYGDLKEIRHFKFFEWGFPIMMALISFKTSFKRGMVDSIALSKICLWFGCELISG